MSQLKHVQCENCGGEVSFDPQTQLTLCSFCGSTFDIAKATDENVEEVASILPFKITQEQFKIAALKWLAQGNYTPDDVLENSVFDKVTGTYIPFYNYDGSYEIKWSGSCGYDRVERVSGGEGTRTTTDWRPASGTINGKFELRGIASKKLPDKFLDFCEKTHLAKKMIKDYDTRYIQGFALAPFVAKPEEVFKSRVKPELDAIVQERVEKAMPGDRQRDISWSGDTPYKETSMYVPFWLATYNYKNEEYRCLVYGRNASKIDGDKPVDKDRKKRVSKYFIPLYIALIPCLIVLFTGSQKALAAGVLIGLIIFGLIGRHKILSRSNEIRRKILDSVLDAEGVIEEEEEKVPAGTSA